MRIIGVVLATPSHTVMYSIFHSFVANYSFHRVFFSAIIPWLGRLSLIICPSSLFRNILVAVVVRTEHLGYTVDENDVFNSVLPKANVFRVYPDDAVRSQLS